MLISFLESHVTGGHQNGNLLEQPQSQVQIPQDSVCSEAGSCAMANTALLWHQCATAHPLNPQRWLLTAWLLLGSPTWAAWVSQGRWVGKKSCGTDHSLTRKWPWSPWLSLFLWQVELAAHDKNPCLEMEIRLLQSTEQHLIVTEEPCKVNRNSHLEAVARCISVSEGCAVLCQLLAQVTDVLAHPDTASREGSWVPGLWLDLLTCQLNLEAWIKM